MTVSFDRCVVPSVGLLLVFFFVAFFVLLAGFIPSQVASAMTAATNAYALEIRGSGSLLWADTKVVGF